MQGIPKSRNQRTFITLIFLGAVTGISARLNQLVSYSTSVLQHKAWIIVSILLSAVIWVFLFWGVQKITRWFVCQTLLPDSVQKDYLKYDTFTYAVFLLTTLGAIGLYIPISGMIFLFLFFQFLLILFFMSRENREAFFSSLGWLSFLFLISGFAALIYQIAWQRVLFTVFGVNIESITIIVSIFMLGLGVGSIIGGRLSAKFPSHLPQLFLTCEFLVGLFGIVSLPIIKSVGKVFLHGSLLTVSTTTYALLSIPTMLMGATLPILVAYLHRYYQNIGKSVGMLYSINTIGSAIACFITASVLFSLFGLQTSVIIAASCNFVVGTLVYRYTRTLQKKARLEKPFNVIKGYRSQIQPQE